MSPADVAFDEYHRANPQVYTAFRRLALRLLNQGVKHYGAKAIMEVVRFQTTVRGTGDAFKINNNYTSRYARMLMAKDERFAGFFELRSLKDESEAA
jgi:hypothetical protein